jgi:hypothetical protein
MKVAGGILDILKDMGGISDICRNNNSYLASPLVLFIIDRSIFKIIYSYRFSTSFNTQ